MLLYTHRVSEKKGTGFSRLNYLQRTYGVMPFRASTFVAPSLVGNGGEPSGCRSLWVSVFVPAIYLPEGRG
ncbi:hypothetical protein QN360_08620 [Glaciimonas sp. CA11.2]|uniref:hypothetical protein n=1 Tax=unclassified Glaciimonas TaxID=2644401 RepID=UPI002AB388AB|nr:MULTISPECIES: hypothetical protein [unclassified Glaciimonas]MDY7546517.1 hypothetical protein [Glaciimonas sp. CA11.2]MEB0080801.1 hypothetical protein [Glaciimonas sp. Gout2]MEB0162971.1 hypothetical protein [Glaciimonas sp. CA11.2]